MTTAHVQGSVLYPALFAEFQFDSGTTRFWSGETSINADLGDGTVSWTGGGLLGGIETSGEGEDIQSRRMRFTLNGVDQSYYATAISTKYRGRPVKLWFAITNSAGTAVSYYYLLEEGRMDTLTVNESDDSITLTLTCESRLVDLFHPRRVFLNNDDLQKEYPDDLFYEYTPTLPGKELPWGLKSGTAGSSGGYDPIRTGNSGTTASQP